MSTTEHIPPFLLFPEGQRIDLITVPSCKKHNLGKQMQDEFIRFVMVSSVESNHELVKQVEDKILRSFEYQPLKKEAFFPYPKVRVIDGEFLRTYKIDINRLNNITSMIAKGIYYYHYNVPWLGFVNTFYGSKYIKKLGDESFNVISRWLEEKIVDYYLPIERNGKNPEIFYYQVVTDTLGRIHIRMVFYSGPSMLCILHYGWDRFLIEKGMGFLMKFYD